MTKFVTQKVIHNKDKLEEDALLFAANVSELIDQEGADNFWNSDQSGFRLEEHYGRTIEVIGTKNVECVAQSTNNLTHSYTIQPLVSASGHLLNRLLVVTKEPSGDIPPSVLQSLELPPNIVLKGSKSGKCTAAITKEWFTDVFSNVPKQAGKVQHLLLDQWSGFKQMIEENNPEEVQIHMIPAGATGLCQPLDLFYFRPKKSVVRTVVNQALFEREEFKPGQRLNILRTQSLIHNQFSAPRFVDFHREAWYKGGYISKPESFVSPRQYCLTLTNYTCQIESCTNISFWKCAYCTNHLCFDCFYFKFHYCNL